MDAFLEQVMDEAREYVHQTQMGGAQTNDGQEPSLVDFAVYLIHDAGFQHGIQAERKRRKGDYDVSE